MHEVLSRYASSAGSCQSKDKRLAVSPSFTFTDRPKVKNEIIEAIN